jgi:hypothetical protein
MAYRADSRVLRRCHVLLVAVSRLYLTIRSTVRIKATQIAKLKTALPAKEHIATQFKWVSCVSFRHIGGGS